MFLCLCFFITDNRESSMILIFRLKACYVKSKIIVSQDLKILSMQCVARKPSCIGEF